MKQLIYVALIIGLSGCGINRQANQIKALERCTYKIISADQISVAGTDVKKLIGGEDINLAGLPGVALALLRQDIPLRARLNLQVKNPTGDAASINQFEYKILINKQELAEGFVNQEVNVGAGQATVVPVDMQINLYPFLSNNKVMQEINDFIKASKSGPERKGILTLKIKPSIKVGNSLVKYPGYISIDKEVSSKILL